MKMTRQEAEEKYQRMGLQTKYFNDPPGKMYRFHRHGETRLYSLSGVAFLKLGEGDDSTYKVILPGDEVLVHDNELHGGIAGPDGWEYVGGAAEFL